MVAIRSTSLIFTSISLLASYVSAYGQIAQVVDAKNFCVFLPPSDSVDRGIADTEWNAQAFCMGSAPLAKNAGKLDSGFIQSAHFLATDKYVQVTGKIDPSKARLNVTDEGGQYDIKAPKGSSCAGWKFYVNLVEPAGNTYCMRCCNDDRSCNRGISEKGCAHIIPGDYSGPEISKSSPKTTTSAKKSTKKTTTTVQKVTTTVNKKIAAATTTTIATAGRVAQAITSDPVQATTTTIAEASTVNSAPVASSTSGASDATTENDAANANTAPVAAEPVAAEPVAAAPPAAANAGSSSSSSADSSTGSSSQPGTMLSQNDKVSEQSVSGAESYRPGMTSMTFAFVLLAIMYQQ